jgi:hypothetical protein
MKWKKWLENWDMTGLKLSVPFLKTEWAPKTLDREAAWDLYVELLTRSLTQPMEAGEGDEQAALESIHELFSITRDVLHRHGRECVEFTKLAIIVLNQIVRPFTSRWHSLACSGAFKKTEQREQFRTELAALQFDLRKYCRMLADVAEVEDLTFLARLEQSNGK